MIVEDIELIIKDVMNIEHLQQIKTDSEYEIGRYSKYTNLDHKLLINYLYKIKILECFIRSYECYNFELTDCQNDIYEKYKNSYKCLQKIFMNNLINYDNAQFLKIPIG